MRESVTERAREKKQNSAERWEREERKDARGERRMSEERMWRRAAQKTELKIGYQKRPQSMLTPLPRLVITSMD